MKCAKIIIPFVLILFFIQNEKLIAQPSQSHTYRESPKRSQEFPTPKINLILDDISKGIASNKIELLFQHIYKKVNLNLTGSESGYYSENQAINIIENYFKMRNVTEFNLSYAKQSEEGPYAVGEGYWNYKGKHEKFQLYVTIVEKENRLVIAKIKIY